jgi:tetratricopeptide (TPR) repeat protein
LAVFAGGFAVDAVETVCVGEGLQAEAMLDLLAQLLDKSLLVTEQQAETTRYRLLETIREYARNRLAESGEEERLCAAHLHYFTSLAEQAERELSGAGQRSWLERLEDEHDNIRAALEWSLGRGGHEMGLRLAGALGRFWEVHGHLSEGRRWLSALLEQDSRGATAERVRALARAGRLADRQSDGPAAVALLEESLSIARTLGDRHMEALLLRYFGEQAYWPGDYARAGEHFTASLAISEELDDQAGICSSLEYLGMLAYSVGDFALAQARLEQSLLIAREIGEMRAVTRALMNLGWSALKRGDYEHARHLCHESLVIADELRDKDSIARALNVLSELELALGDLARARSLYEQWSAIWRELGADWVILAELQFRALLAREDEDYVTAQSLLEDVIRIERDWGYRASMISNLAALGDVLCRQGDWRRAATVLGEAVALASEVGAKFRGCESIEALAKVAAAQGEDEAAACLFGASDALREAMDAPLHPSERAEYDACVGLIRARLDSAAFEEAWARGRTMSWRATVDEALITAAEVAGVGTGRRPVRHSSVVDAKAEPSG